MIDKVRIWEKKEGKYTKTLFKIQVTVTSLTQDTWRNNLPKFIDAMLVPIQMGINMAAGNQQKHLSPRFAAKA